MGLQIRRRRSLKLVAGVAIAAFVASCTTTQYRARFTHPGAQERPARTEQFLKCHMKNGELFVLEAWSLDDQRQLVLGKGIRYDARRTPAAQGNLAVPFAEIALLETNDPESVTRSGVAVMAVVTGVSLAATALCLANPKACFGSCPTFYADDGSGKGMVLQAEGFSSSIARSYEETDVDSMWTVRPRDGVLDLLMTNDALETHFVDKVRLVVVPRSPGARVFRAGDRYYPARHVEPPARCTSALGDCVPALTAADKQEYASTTDGVDSASREQIELEFPRGSGPAGLVVAARNSLLNTFLFYQALAYMGRSAGEWYMGIDRSSHGELGGIGEFGKLLGDVEVSVKMPDGSFAHAGSYSEVGPIAREVQLVPLPEPGPDAGDHWTVRLTLTKGNWKLDQVGLADLGEAVLPTYVEPSAVIRKGRPDPAALSELLAPDEHLVTYPGDAYTLRFVVPSPDAEFFLESRGYYYEWIRESWLAEEDSFELLRFFADPKGALERLAPAYKRIEGDMDRVFWQSRVGRK